MVVSHLSLFKRGRYWYLQFTDDDGRKRQQSTRRKLKDEALQVLLEFKQRSYVKPKPKSLSAFIEEFIQFAQGAYARGTVTIYRSALRNFLRIVGDASLSAFTPKHFDRYRTERLKAIAPITVNIELRTLKAAMNVAKRWGYIPSNPFQNLSQIPIPEAEPLFFTKQDFQLLLNTIREQWFKEVVLFAVLTGMRRGEIVNLTWKNIDFDRRVIHVVSSENYRTKQGKRRVIPMNDVCFDLLMHRFRSSVCELVFHRRGFRLQEFGLSHLLKKYVRLLGLNDRLHFHSLRHSFASWLAQANVSIYTLKELLGHSDVKTTQVYSHLVSTEMHGVVNKIQIERN